MAKAEDQRFLVISASEGEAYTRFHGPPCATVDEATALRDKLRKAGSLARMMRAAAQPSAKPPPPRWYCIVAAISDADVEVSDAEASEAAARATSLQGIRSQPGGPPPVSLSAIREGTDGPYQAPEE